MIYFDNRSCRISQFFVSLLFVLAILMNYSTAQTATVSLVEREGNSVTYLCESIYGTPLIEVQWYFNGSTSHCCLENAEKSQANLQMKVSPACEGNIQCGGQDRAEFVSSDKMPVYGK